MIVRFKWGMSDERGDRVALSRDAEMPAAPRVGDLVVTMTGWDARVLDLLILPWDDEFGAYVTLQDWPRATVGRHRGGAPGWVDRRLSVEPAGVPGARSLIACSGRWRSEGSADPHE